jgi:flavodoxin
VAKKIAEVLGADLKKPNEVTVADLAKYDLIGFGSGIYSSKFHASVLNFINELPDMAGKKAFVFFTCSLVVKPFSENIINELKKKNFNIIGDFGCQGGSTWHPFGFTLNVFKGHPNEKDLLAAEKFAKKLVV